MTTVRIRTVTVVRDTLPTPTGVDGRALIERSEIPGWEDISQVPATTGVDGRALIERSNVAGWEAIEQLPTPSGVDGRVLTETGSVASWQDLPATIDELVKISATDTTADYLAGKIAAGTNIDLVVQDAGADETISINTLGNVAFNSVSVRAVAGSAGSEQYGESAGASAVNATAFGYSCSVAGIGSIGAGANADVGGDESAVMGYLAVDGDFNYASIVGARAIGAGEGCSVLGRNATGRLYGVSVGHAASSSGYGVSIGRNASSSSAANTFAIAIGDSATASSGAGALECISIGHDASSSGDYSICIGASATDTANTESVVIGGGSASTGVRATSIGRSASAAANAIALGYDADATGDFSICIASGKNVTQDYAIGIGCSVSGVGAVGTGFNAVASASNACAYGRQASSTGADGTAIGFNSRAVGNYSVAIGDCRANTDQSVAIGDAVDITGLRCTVIGSNCRSAQNDNIIAGYNSSNITGIRCAILGSQITIKGSQSVCVGYGSNADGSNQVAIGYQANACIDTTANCVGAIAIGYQAQTAINASSNFTFAIAQGYQAHGYALYAVAIGGTASVTATGGSAYAYGASVASDYGIAIGYQSSVGASGSSVGAIAIGEGALVGSTATVSTGAISIGDGAVVNGAGSIAIGLGATINGYANALAFGEGATCSADNTGEIGTSSDPIALKGYSDLDWSGGYAQTVGPWVQDDVAASQTDVALGLGLAVTRTERIMTRAGSVLGVVVYSNEARTAGTATVEVTINGTGTGLTAVLDGTDTQTAIATQAKDTDAFSAGQRIGVQITTSADWAPTTADLTVEVLIEQ